MENNLEELTLEEQLENAIMDSLGGKDEILLEETYPTQIHLIPIIRRPFFPGMAAPIMIEPGPFYEVLKEVAKSENKYLGMVLTKADTQDVYKATTQDLFDVGILARILRIIPSEQGGAQVVLNMEKRIKILNEVDSNNPLLVNVSYQEDSEILTTELKAYAISIISTIKELLKLNPLFKEELQIFLSHSDFTEPSKLADFAVALTTASREELQDVLSTFDIHSRVDKALRLLKKEVDLSMLQNNLNKKIESTIAKSQKEYFLREQLKTIKRELGIEKDEKASDREKFETRLKGKTVPEEVLKTIKEELDKLAGLDTNASEYSICRNYLDWLTITPWGVVDHAECTLESIEKSLMEDHYGLEEVKERILEFVAINKLSGKNKGNIICLAGPPGVGKTSIGKSIAKALNRKFYRFSVGGMRDEAEIKGHRRTYIGAMPGKLVQALKICQTSNPIIMLDEIDKIGNSYHGDPASALLEVLDPEQNSNFLDHYLDVPCDLSNVLFILTANVLDTIPEPLKDRMEILRLSGYILEEKIQIAEKYLIPRNLAEAGIKPSGFSLPQETIKKIIQNYAREAGVRSLEGCIKKIIRKIATKLVKIKETSEKPKRNKKTIITEKDLESYLGKPIFLSDSFYSSLPSGVATGLAWTAMGGATLYIESIKLEAEKTSMKLTGQAGDVMKESSEIAWSYLQSKVETFAPGKSFFKNLQVHMHIPEGATPKDGPSAGVTMVSSILSLLLDQPIPKNVGMTGELTLTGKVLPVGGIKEKIISAKRSELNIIILPKVNQRDYDELPEYIKENITVHFVENYSEIYEIIFSKRKENTKNVIEKKKDKKVKK